jgi:hypothetical protein
LDFSSISEWPFFAVINPILRTDSLPYPTLPSFRFGPYQGSNTCCIKIVDGIVLTRSTGILGRNLDLPLDSLTAAVGVDLTCDYQAIAFESNLHPGFGIDFGFEWNERILPLIPNRK